MPKRIGLFIDYQNVYRRARSAFARPGDLHVVGQVDPLKVGQLISEKTPNSALEFVRIYRGLPDGGKDPKGNAACSRQVAAWTALQCVEVFTRPLRYPQNYPAEKPNEKGIDVQLAIDFVVAALDRRFDVGVIFSADTDLKPAIETVIARTTVEVAVATWQPPTGYASRISISTRKIWCHYLGEVDFSAVKDLTDYST
jgi:uncharacterized LabA/DUF88 family protein